MAPLEGSNARTSQGERVASDGGRGWREHTLASDAAPPVKRALSDSTRDEVHAAGAAATTTKRVFVDAEFVDSRCSSETEGASSPSELSASSTESRDDRYFSDASASACDGLDNWVHYVRFARAPTVMGRADADYDRTPIRVDLSKTPYALFHKDYVLLKNPKDASPQNGSSGGSRGDRSRSTSSAGPWSEDPSLQRQESGSSDDEWDFQRPNFSGVWRRTRVEGFEELLRFSGVDAANAARAASRTALHVIDHDDDYVRLIVKNGLVKVDSHYIIGDEARVEKAGAGASYSVSLFWGDGTGDGVENQLVLSSVDAAAGKEMIAIRTLSEDGNTLILQQIVRLTNTKEEARAKHYFARVKDRGALKESKLL